MVSRWRRRQGLVDPVTREGIYFALRSGEWAAEAAASSGGSIRYQERVQDDIAADLVCAAQYKAKFFEPRFRGSFSQRCATAEGSRDRGRSDRGRPAYAT